MPESPFKRVIEEGLNQPDGRSKASEGKRKRKPKPTSKAKNRKKKIKKRYSAAREEAQLAGVIPTTPDGAVHEERVPSSAQSVQPLPELVVRAICQGWATHDDKKSELVEEMVAIVLNQDMPAKAKIAAFNALRMADQMQFERDHPEEANKIKGGSSVTVNLQNNIQAAALLRGMMERGEFRITGEMQASGEPSTSSDSGLKRQVAASQTPDEDKRDVGGGVADS